MSSYVEIADDRGNVQRVPVEARGAGWAGDDRQQANQLARSEAGRTAGAIAAGHLVTGFLDDGSTATSQKAAEVINDLGESLANSEFAPEPLEPRPVTRTDSGLHVVQQPEEQPALPTDYELPPEYAFLNETDEQSDDDEELEPAAVAPVDEEPEPDALDLDEDDLLDPRIAALVAKNVKLEKTARHEQQLRVKTSRPTWEQEAARVFRLGDVPLLDADDFATIKADSKREFLRQAKTIADRNKRAVLRFAPVQRSEAEIVRETKAQVWGDPPAGTPPSSAQVNDYEARLARARRSAPGQKGLVNVFKEMIRGE